VKPDAVGDPAHLEGHIVNGMILSGANDPGYRRREPQLTAKE